MSGLVVLATFSTRLTTSSSTQSTQPPSPIKGPLVTSTKSPTLITLRTSLHGTAIVPDPLLPRSDSHYGGVFTRRADDNRIIFFKYPLLRFGEFRCDDEGMIAV